MRYTLKSRLAHGRVLRHSADFEVEGVFNTRAIPECGCPGDEPQSVCALESMRKVCEVYNTHSGLYVRFEGGQFYPLQFNCYKPNIVRFGAVSISNRGRVSGEPTHVRVGVGFGSRIAYTLCKSLHLYSLWISPTGFVAFMKSAYPHYF